MFHESLAATTDMSVLLGVLGCRLLRRTVQVRLEPIPRYRGTVAQWQAHLRGLATAIHEISGYTLPGEAGNVVERPEGWVAYDPGCVNGGATGVTLFFLPKVHEQPKWENG
jgi:hypothetical protein